MSEDAAKQLASDVATKRAEFASASTRLALFEFDRATSFDLKATLPGFLNKALDDSAGLMAKDMNKVVESVAKAVWSDKKKSAASSQPPEEQPANTTNTKKKSLFGRFFEELVAEMINGFAKLIVTAIATALVMVFAIPCIFFYRTVTNPMASLAWVVVGVIYCVLSVWFAVQKPSAAYLVIKHKMHKSTATSKRGQAVGQKVREGKEQREAKKSVKNS